MDSLLIYFVKWNCSKRKLKLRSRCTFSEKILAMCHLLFQPVYKELIPPKRSSKDKSGPVEDTMVELMTHVKEKAASKELDISKFLEVNHLCVIVSFIIWTGTFCRHVEHT